MKFLPTEARTYVVFFLGAQILNVHDLNTNLNYLSSNILSLYCIFDVQNLVLCLNRELIKIIDYRFMLKLQCKTKFNSVFVGKKNHQIRIRVDFGIMFFKNVVLYSDRILFAHLCRHIRSNKFALFRDAYFFRLKNIKIVLT